MRGWITDSKVEGGLRLAEDLPEPDPGEGEIVVGVKAYSINRGELSLVAERPDGFRPGQDVAGIVVRSAARGGPPIGARVVGLVDWNGWAERVAVRAAHVAVLPAQVSFAQAATLPVAGVTALRAVRMAGDLLGRRVLVTGAAGGVGQVAVQLAAIAGARVTALVRKAEEVRGAHEVVTSLGARRYDVVLDGVGGTTLIEALHGLAPGGLVAMYGVLAGKAPLDIFDFASCPNARLVGMFLHEPGERCGEELETLATLLAEQRLRPAIGVTDDWTRTADALRAMGERRVTGKAVLTLA
jgi:NADPH:quinone reductase-like Zn-dependent oxidoreductase